MVSAYGSGTSSHCDATWVTWVETSATATTSCSTANYVWSSWASNTTSTTSITSPVNTAVWQPWIIVYIKQQSDEEIEEQNKPIKEQEEARREKERIKEETARQLLREVLSDEQNKQFDEKGFFELTSVKSGNIYRINKGRSRNVELLDKNKKKLKRLCFHPGEYVHDYDTMVAQKLMLENYEEDVKKVANYS